MVIKTDGGAAFPGKRPFKYYSMGDHKGVETVPGMSLRDYFAAKVLQGFMVRADGVNDLDDEYLIETSMTCYRMADAMLAARENKS